MFNSCRVLLGLALASTATIAGAQDSGGEPWRYRVTLGAAIQPKFPGADDTRITPAGGLSRARGDDPFAFGAPDDSAGISLTGNNSAFGVGPVVGLQGKRRSKDTNGLLPEVKWTIEAGGFVQFVPSENLRVRLEARQGVNGHKAFVADLGADYIARNGDNWLFSIGPRVSYASAKYQRAYFGVPVTTGPLVAYRPGSGIQSYGGTTSARFELGGGVGLFGWGKYDRLTGDAARSPVVVVLGSRDQWSGGLGLSYTFGGRR
jgi:outer membrane protein